MEFREGALPVDDPECGRFVVEGDGYAAAGELVTLVVVAEVSPGSPNSIHFRMVSMSAGASGVCPFGGMLRFEIRWYNTLAPGFPAATTAP